MNPPQPQQFLEQIEKNDDDDYLQVLDAGEHMYGMFVTDDEDLYAYLSGEEPSSSWIIPSTEDIEDIIHMSVVPGLDMQNKQCVEEDCCCASFVDMHIRGKGTSGGEVSASFDWNIDNDGTNNGRLTPTPNGDDDDDAMNE